MILRLWIVFYLFGLPSYFQQDNKVACDDLQVLVDSVRLQYVPDRRDNVYDISVSCDDNRAVVRGVTSVAEAKTELLNRIRSVCPDIVDSIRVLPDENLEGCIYGVANVSVADLRTTPGYSAEMATQLLLGTSMQLLQIRQGWYNVRTPEGYIAWIQQGAMVRMNREQFMQWECAPKIIFTDDYGFAYETPDENRQRMSDLVFGNQMKHTGDEGMFYRVCFPDGREAYVLKSQSSTLNEWKTNIRLTEESIVEKALELKGIPYTWGGTSVKAMDCSGFTKMVYLKHGIVLRRDASQQAQTGTPVDLSNGYDNLRPGDLLFFGKKQVRHVAIYLGNKEFIHVSGYVRINSLDPEQPHYDEANAVELIGARRMFN